MQICPVSQRRQRHMRIKRRLEFEALRFGRELVEPEQAPLCPSVICDVQFVTFDVEGSALPSVVGLHFDQSMPAIWREAFDIVAKAVTFFLGCPANFWRQDRHARMTEERTARAKPPVPYSRARGRSSVDPSQRRRTCGRH